MRIRYIVTVLSLMLVAGLVHVRAQDADKPKKSPAARLIQPWSQIASLSEEQKAKIKEIHGKALVEIKAIREREQSEIMALLSDEQKEELKSLQEKERAAKKTAKANPQSQ